MKLGGLGGKYSAKNVIQVIYPKITTKPSPLLQLSIRTSNEFALEVSIQY